MQFVKFQAQGFHMKQACSMRPWTTELCERCLVRFILNGFHITYVVYCPPKPMPLLGRELQSSLLQGSILYVERYQMVQEPRDHRTQNEAQRTQRQTDFHFTDVHSNNQMTWR